MFIGEYKHSLDQKGRLAIPHKFRVSLKKGAVITKGLDNCLFLYTKQAWEAMAAKMSGLPFNKANDRAMARHFLAGAMAVDFDVQGRVTLPEYLRHFAGLKQKVIVAGLYDRLEIWDETAWNKYKAATEKASNAIAEALDGLGTTN